VFFGKVTDVAGVAEVVSGFLFCVVLWVHRKELNTMKPNTESQILETLETAPKHPLTSKTIIGLVLYFLPALLMRFGVDVDAVFDGLEGFLENAGGVLTIIGLRTAKQPLSLPSILGGKSGAASLGFFVLCGLSGLAALSLPSCGPQGMPITGKLSYNDKDSGVTGGVVLSPDGKPRPWVHMPFYDEEGNEVAAVDWMSGK